MSKQVNIRNSTRINWETTPKNEHGYPGDENIKLGCLMRIADATEKMASNYQRMEDDLKRYKQRYEKEAASSLRLLRANRALKGHLKRIKNNTHKTN